MNARNIDPSITEQWENGELGRSEEHVVVAPEAESLELDSALAMKLISIRLPLPLIEALKAIAAHHGIAYQPMVRDLLTRFARSEINQIVSDLDHDMKASQTEEEITSPVEGFIARTRKTA